MLPWDNSGKLITFTRHGRRKAYSVVLLAPRSALLTAKPRSVISCSSVPTYRRAPHESGCGMGNTSSSGCPVHSYRPQTVVLCGGQEMLGCSGQPSCTPHRVEKLSASSPARSSSSLCDTSPDALVGDGIDHSPYHSVSDASRSTVCLLPPAQDSRDRHRVFSVCMAW